MPDSPDDRPSDPTSAVPPSSGPSDRPESEPAGSALANPSVDHVSKENDIQGPTADSGDAPRPPRRRRRRRRPRHATDTPASASPGQAERSATADNAPASEAPPATPPSQGVPQRRRRRRRGPRREAAGSTETGRATQATQDTPESSPNVTPPSDDVAGPEQPHPQSRGRRRRRPPRPAEVNSVGTDKIVAPQTAASTRAASSRQRPAPYRGSHSRGPHDRPVVDDRPRERGPIGDNRSAPDRRTPGRHAPGPGNRRRRRDRDAPSKKPEPRLYALESIVDRGFEDIVDAAEDNLTRRVHWTIMKRTVADQGSGKLISATYVLQRDGVDTEYPGLATARAAANKTIIHPEKLTLSKAEHAAAKK